MQNVGKNVWVGLSGGVDSAVSAALLKEQGYDVTGVFIKIWSPEFLECTWREDRLDAMRVAVHLDIPFLEVDLSEEYKDSVIANMLHEYEAGRTPNPDVLCNETIKFGAFAKWAFKNGAEILATGHYVRVETRESVAHLLKGIDPAKDQTYFLYRMPKAVIEKTIFPVGGFTKKQIREKALSLRLPNAERPDSQGLCFVGDVSMQEFLSRFIALKKGVLVNESSEHIGEHDGAMLYTIGQRHGFRLLPIAGDGPYYVIGIDTKKNIVRVSRNVAVSKHAGAMLSDIHWINEPLDEDMLTAAPRYHAKEVPVKIVGNKVYFAEPVQLTPGQSLVFYRGEECLGGGIIHTVEV